MLTIEKIHSEMVANAATIPAIGKKLKFILDDYVMVIDGTGDENVVLLEDCEASCTITMSIETYGKIQNKELKPFMATMTGKIKVRGDLSLAKQLKQLM